MAEFDLTILRIHQHHDAARQPRPEICCKEIRAVLPREMRRGLPARSPTRELARDRRFRPLPHIRISERLALESNNGLLRGLFGVAPMNASRIEAGASDIVEAARFRVPRIYHCASSVQGSMRMITRDTIKIFIEGDDHGQPFILHERDVIGIREREIAANVVVEHLLKSLFAGKDDTRQRQQRQKIRANGRFRMAVLLFQQEYRLEYDRVTVRTCCCPRAIRISNWLARGE